MAVCIPFPVLKYSCFPCHSPVCSDNAHSTLRCYEACCSQQHNFQPLGMETGATSHSRWTFKLKFALGCHIPNYPFPFVLMANIVIPPDHWGKRFMKFSHNSHLTCAMRISSRAVLFFSSDMFPAYSQYSSWASSSLCQVWNTSLYNFPHGTFMYSSPSLILSISKPFPLWRPWETQLQLSLLTSPFNFSKFVPVKYEILIRDFFLFILPFKLSQLKTTLVKQLPSPIQKVTELY